MAGGGRTGITEPPVTKPRFLAYVPDDRFLEWKLTDTDTSRNGVSIWRLNDDLGLGAVHDVNLDALARDGRLAVRKDDYDQERQNVRREVCICKLGSPLRVRRPLETRRKVGAVSIAST